MGAGAHETVEFLDLLPGAPGSDTTVDQPADHGGSHRGLGVLGVLVVVAGVLAAARVSGSSPPAVPATAAEAPVFGGEVLLPAGFGTPRQLGASGVDADVVWALGADGRVVRIENGRVTASSAGRGYHALAVRPDGRAVFVATGRLAPTVVVLDPRSLEPGAQVATPRPVTALGAGVGSVWAVSGRGVQGWTTDLRRPLRTMALPPEVTAVRSLAVVGPRVQAVVTTTPGTTALLRLEPPGGSPQLTSAFRGPVSIVPGVPALVAHVDARHVVEVVVDPATPGTTPLGRPLTLDASVWPARGVGTATWVATARGSAGVDCYDPRGQLVGRTAVGDTGHGIAGPVVTTPRAVYAVTTEGELARGGHASCGVAPRASTGGRRGD